MRLATKAARGTATASAMSPDQKGVAAKRAQRGLRPSAPTKTAKDELHHQRVEDKQEDKETEQLGEDFGGHEKQLLAALAPSF